MARWQSDYALDCKPGLGRFNSYPGLQLDKYWMKIIGCGCSFTYGYHKSIVGPTKVKDYISILSALLNAESVNLARPGFSNYAISKQIEHAISLNPDLLIVGVTTPMRIDFSFPEKNFSKRPDIYDFDYSNYINRHELIGNKENIVSLSLAAILEKSKTDSRYTEVFDFHIKYTNEWIRKDIDRLLMLGVFSLLEKKSIPYVCIDFCDTFNEGDVKNYINHHYLDLCKRFPLPNDPQHFNESGHEFLANQILNFKKEIDMKRGKR